MGLPRLIFVTGKGGTGKSTLAAALALAIARGRGRSILASIDGRGSAARMLAPGADGKPSRRGRASVQPELMTLDRRAELEAFIARIVPMRAIADRMLRSRTFGYVTAAVPGLEAFLMMERLRIAAGDAALHDYHVVADAPASGGALEMLEVAAGLRALAPLGTLNRLAAGVEALLIDPDRFGVLLTATPDQLAVREAIDTARRLRQLGIVRIRALLNCTVDTLFAPAELAAIRSLDGHHRLALRRRELGRRSEEARRRLAAAKLEPIEIPMLFRAELGEREFAGLARRLGEALLADEVRA